MSEFDDVRGTYVRFGFIAAGEQAPHELPPEQAAERIAFMQEELDEYRAAVAAGDLPGQADALADLKVVACGTEALQHLPANEIWREVQRANNDKVPGAGRHHGNRPGADMVKPPGWRAPDHAPILRAHGWTPPAAPADDVDPAAQSIACLACGRPTVNGRQPCPGCSGATAPEAIVDRTSDVATRLVREGKLSPCTTCARVPDYVPSVCDRCDDFRAWERSRPAVRVVDGKVVG